MATADLKIGIVGGGPAASALADRFRAMEGVSLVGSSDADPSADRPAEAKAALVPSFDGHVEMLRQVSPDALVISTPRRSHYRPAIDGLQAGCHLLILTPLSSSVQEAADIVGLARARALTVALGHSFRRLPSLIRLKEMVAAGSIGRLRLVTSTLCRPADADPPSMRGGALADFGLDWLDALLWSAGRPAGLVASVQATHESGLDLLTTASIRLGDGIIASLAASGISAAETFEAVFHGEGGRLRATDRSLVLEMGNDEPRAIPPGEAPGDVATGFIAALRDGSPPPCPAGEALDAVRLLEAIARSAATGQFVGLA